MASNIAEGLVERGWDVTLFATADSITKAKLHAVIDKGYEEDLTQDAKVVECLQISEMMEHAGEFDLIHNNYDFLPLTYTRLIDTPMLTTTIPESPLQPALRPTEKFKLTVSMPRPLPGLN